MVEISDSKETYFARCAVTVFNLAEEFKLD